MNGSCRNCIESVDDFDNSVSEFDLSNLDNLLIFDNRLMVANFDSLSFFLFKCDLEMTLMSQGSGRNTKIR
jgi:hypothetical protein